jgi:hypothetical protein
MSDLQCPASVLLLAPDALSAGALLEKRLSLLVVASSEHTAELAARALAADSGCPLRVVDLPDGPSVVRQVDELADLHRGETIAVVAAQGAIEAALGCSLAPAAAVTVAVDSSGWTLVRVK